MKIIAFDSECSRDIGLYCELCMFGYAVADESFNIEVSKQIFVNASKPTGRSKKFCRTDYSKFKNAPRYRVVRSQIESIFGKEDTILISHSPEITFRYLCCMDRREGLGPMRCNVLDIKSMVRNYADIPSYSLSAIAKLFGIPYDSKESNVDAKTCIRIFQYLCKEENTDPVHLIEMCGKGAVVDSEVVYHSTLLSFKKERLQKYYDGKMHHDGFLNGKVFSMAESFEDQRIEIGFRIAEYVTSNGGKLTRKVSESSSFVWDGNIDSKRLESANLMPDDAMSIISTDELFAMHNSEVNDGNQADSTHSD